MIFKKILYAIMPIIILFVAVFLASAIAYYTVLTFGDSVSFRDIFKRASQLLLIPFIFPFMRLCKLTSYDVGFAGRIQLFKQIKKGFWLGFITLFPVLTILFLLGVNEINLSKPWTLAWFINKLVLNFILSLLISIFEEPIFRGVLLICLIKKLPLNISIAITAFYYAGLHFVNSNIEIPTQEASLLSGFILLKDALNGLLNITIIIPYLAIFTVGVFLGMLRTQVNVSLGLCIGCHTAWVWLIKSTKSFFSPVYDSKYIYLVSGYDGVIGPLVTVWLLLFILAYFIFLRRKIDLLRFFR